MEENWQLKIFRKSLKKKQRVSKLSKYCSDLAGKKCLELGCARGIIGYHLRQQGGNWISIDTDLENVSAAAALLGQNVLQAEPLKLPFPDRSLDFVAALDILEHLEQDQDCIREIHRVVKPGGIFLVSAPSTGRFFLVNRLKHVVGLTPDIYGHVREGYDPKQLAGLLQSNGFTVRSIETFTRFFTEFLEMMINVGYITLTRKKQATRKRDGAISPSSEQELKKNITVFRIYSLLYPISWLVSQLDHLLFFQKGYTLVLLAEKK